MEFFDIVNNRYSVRSFLKKGVEKEKLDKILEAANLAPSAGNLQAYEIVVVIKEDSKRKLASASSQDFVCEAPVVLVVLANESRSSLHYGFRGKLYSINDASIAATYIQLAATALGLGSCWVGAFDDKIVAKIVNAPDYMKPIAILPIGYPKEKPGKKTRRGIKDIAHKEKIRE